MTRAVLLAASLLAAFVLLGRSVRLAPTEADLEAARFALLVSVAGVGPLLDLFNRMGQAVIWLGLVAWICLGFALRRRWDVVALLVLGELAEVAVAIAKTAFDRARPLPLLGDQFAGVDTGSFPSGHVTRTFATLGVLALYVTPPRWRTLAAGLAVVSVSMIGVARVGAFEHWLTDVIGGVLLGGAWLALLGVIAPLLSRQPTPPHNQGG